MPARFTPKDREMLDRIKRATDNSGAMLQMPIIAEGDAAAKRLRHLIDLGLVERCEHPTIERATGIGAYAVRVTDAGRRQ